jgi:hypothetical protein
MILLYSTILNFFRCMIDLKTRACGFEFPMGLAEIMLRLVFE